MHSQLEIRRYDYSSHRESFHPEEASRLVHREKPWTERVASTIDRPMQIEDKDFRSCVKVQAGSAPKFKIPDCSLSGTFSESTVKLRAEVKEGTREKIFQWLLKNEEYIPVVSTITAGPRAIGELFVVILAMRDVAANGGSAWAVAGLGALAIGRQVVTAVPVLGNALVFACDKIACKMLSEDKNSTEYLQRINDPRYKAYYPEGEDGADWINDPFFKLFS